MKRVILTTLTLVFSVAIWSGSSVAEAQTVDCVHSSEKMTIEVDGAAGSWVDVFSQFLATWWECTLRVETWIDGLADNEKDCTLGQLFGGACVHTASQSTASAKQKSKSEAADKLWGTWSGRAHYTAIRSDTGASVAHPNRSASIGFGSRPPTGQEECEGPPPLGVWMNDMCNYYSPLLIPLDREEQWTLTSAAGGVVFDLDGDGVIEQVSWTPRGSSLAFLAIDRDGDGQITSGLELFGNNTIAGIESGFDALAALMPNNGDGAIDEDDPIYRHLLLWTDRNHNGVSESHELRPAREFVTKIGLGYRSLTNRRDEHGNVFALQGWAEVRTNRGRNHSSSAAEHESRLLTIYDVIFQPLQ